MDQPTTNITIPLEEYERLVRESEKLRSLKAFVKGIYMSGEEIRAFLKDEKEVKE